jgi:hypothetical protein
MRLVVFAELVCNNEEYRTLGHVVSELQDAFWFVQTGEPCVEARHCKLAELHSTPVYAFEAHGYSPSKATTCPSLSATHQSSKLYPQRWFCWSVGANVFVAFGGDGAAAGLSRGLGSDSRPEARRR